MRRNPGARVRLAAQRDVPRAGAIVLAWLMTACGGSGSPAAPSSPPPASTGPALSALSLFPTQIVVLAGDAIPLAVTARDTAGADVASVTPQYTSSNAAVVRVQADGLIVAAGIGTATVRASAGGRTAEAIVHVGSPTYDLAALGPPRVLDANYIELAKIGRISRFRSTVGHSYTDGSEDCRSMKHYFEPMASVDWRSVEVYAPTAGTIFLVATDGAAGYRVMIRPRDAPALQVALFHVDIDPGVVRNAWVEAGQRIGHHATPFSLSDIAVSVGPKEGGMLISFFETMTDGLFAQFQARGVASRQAAIITRAERDGDPVPCVGEQQFTVHGTLPDWLVLN